jgi:exonuclease III
MDHQNKSNNREWKILSWNIGGINGTNKWMTIRSKISERNCDIPCLQETKRAHFDQAYMRNFSGPVFDCFEYIPSQGLSGGTIVI